MKHKFVMIGLVIAIAAISCAAADVTWQPRTVQFADRTTIGSTTVPAGEYKVEHVMKGEEHVMVFTSKDNKSVRAESKCHMVKSSEKGKQTTQAFELSNGQNKLKTLTFKGDAYIHELY